MAERWYDVIYRREASRGAVRGYIPQRVRLETGGIGGIASVADF